MIYSVVDIPLSIFTYIPLTFLHKLIIIISANMVGKVYYLELCNLSMNIYTVNTIIDKKEIVMDYSIV